MPIVQCFLKMNSDIYMHILRKIQFVKKMLWGTIIEIIILIFDQARNQILVQGTINLQNQNYSNLYINIVSIDKRLSVKLRFVYFKTENDYQLSHRQSYITNLSVSLEKYYYTVKKLTPRQHYIERKKRFFIPSSLPLLYLLVRHYHE